MSKKRPPPHPNHQAKTAIVMFRVTKTWGGRDIRVKQTQMDIPEIFSARILAIFQILGGQKQMEREYHLIEKFRLEQDFSLAMLTYCLSINNTLNIL